MAETSLPHLVRDLMTVGVVTCTPQTTVPELAQLLLDHDLDEVIVLDDGKSLGVVGQDDLIAAIAKDGAKSLSAGDVMREGVPQIPRDIPLKAAAQIMRDQRERTLFLMHHAGDPAAAISYKHYLRYLAAADLADLHDLGIKAERIPPLEDLFQRRTTARNKNITREV